jgi:hypothetical protein
MLANGSDVAMIAAATVQARRDGAVERVKRVKKFGGFRRFRRVKTVKRAN